MYLINRYINIFMGLNMDKETEKKALAALKRQEKQYKRQNYYIKTAFDRVSVTLPKGTKDKIVSMGESVNGYINRLVKEDLEKREKP